MSSNFPADLVNAAFRNSENIATTATGIGDRPFSAISAGTSAPTTAC